LDAAGVSGDPDNDIQVDRFLTQDEGVQLGALFLEDARLGEAAELSARLITLAETGAGAGLAGCARAAERLQSYANGLENRLVKRFDAAEAARDVAEMARAASVLVRFNGGSALMARFVSTRRVFLQLGPADDALLGLGEEAALHDSGSTRPPSGEAEAGEQAAASLRRLGAHFKELLRAAKEEVALAVRVFGEAGRGCAAQLVQRLLEQRVRAALERALCSIGETDDLYRRLAHLLLLAGAAERAAELASRLAQLPGCGGDGSFDATTAVGELFTQWREGYLEEELSVQEALAVGVSMESAERRLARAPDALARAALLLLWRRLPPAVLRSEGGDPCVQRGLVLGKLRRQAKQRKVIGLQVHKKTVTPGRIRRSRTCRARWDC
jgi:hypothetical protein